jgi:hypothetical protein
MIANPEITPKMGFCPDWRSYGQNASVGLVSGWSVGRFTYEGVVRGMRHAGAKSPLVFQAISARVNSCPDTWPRKFDDWVFPPHKNQCVAAAGHLA